MVLITDVAVFKIFKFHLNSMVLNILTTPGGFESLGQTAAMKAFAAFLLLLVAAAQWFFLKKYAALAEKLTGRRLKLAAALLLAFVLTDKGLSAWGTLYDSVYITRNQQLFPLYRPLSIRGFARKHFGMKLDEELKGGIYLKYSMLTYPRAPLAVEPPARPLNFVVIVIDSMRADTFNAENAPETWAFSRNAAVFNRHYSGGNCTRFGIFSVFYGIYGNYWFGMLGENRGPLLLDVLKQQGYDLRLFASTRLTFPEFNKTCFVNVPREGIYDQPKAEQIDERDKEIAGKLIDYIRGRKPGKPYFAFLFYDTAHGNYLYPPGFDRFKPVEDPSRLNLTLKNSRGLFNKYRNSVYYDDYLTGGILKAIKETGGLKDTVVLVLGDHGEAFMERGRYGHNQTYTPEEVRVPLVLYVPGRGHSSTDELTSHLDIVPTLMPLAGVKNPSADYSSGRGLFGKEPRPFVASFSWDTAAIIRKDGTLVMPMEAYKGGVKAYDGEFRELDKKAAASYAPLIADFQKEAGKFSK